jgi:hypothetical protein
VERGCGVLAACIASSRLEAKATTRRRKPAPHTSKWCGNGCVSAVLPPDPVPLDPGRTFSGCDLRATGDQGESREGRRMTGNGAACSRRSEVAGLAWGSPQGIPPCAPGVALSPKTAAAGAGRAPFCLPASAGGALALVQRPPPPRFLPRARQIKGEGSVSSLGRNPPRERRRVPSADRSQNAATPTTGHPRRAPPGSGRKARPRAGSGAREGDPVIAVGAEWIAPVFPGCPRNPPPT